METVTEEGEFVAVGIAFFVVEIAGQVPPFGFKFGMRAVITRKGPRPRGGGVGPGIRCIEARGCEAEE